MAKYIGIDVHKRTSHVVVFDGDEEKVVLNKNILTDRNRFDDVLGPLAPAKVLIEASTQSRWVAEHLESLGHEVVVGDPNYQVMYASRPANCKNDEKDAEALTFALRHGHYRAVHRVSEENRRTRELLGTRARLIEIRTVLAGRIRMTYAAHGEACPGGVGAELLRQRIVERGVPACIAESVRPLLDMLAMLEDQLDVCDRRLEEIASANPIVARMRTVPGIGLIVALAFVAYIDTPTRFAGAHPVESYVGLTPRLQTSGKVGEGGAISKRGATYLRALFVQAAWGLLRSDDPKARPLQEWAMALAARRNKKVAVTALARRLVGVLYAVWRDEKTFELREPATKAAQPPGGHKPLVKRYRLTGRRAAGR